MQIGRLLVVLYLADGYFSRTAPAPPPSRRPLRYSVPPRPRAGVMPRHCDARQREREVSCAGACGRQPTTGARRPRATPRAECVNITSRNCISSIIPYILTENISCPAPVPRVTGVEVVGSPSPRRPHPAGSKGGRPARPPPSTPGLPAPRTGPPRIGRAAPGDCAWARTWRVA